MAIALDIQQLVEQSRVLDGDDGLIGKCPDQGDLFFIKWRGLASRSSNCTDP